jgi:uncharacterized protein
LAESNLERMRLGYEAFGRGDVQAVFELLDPGIELHDRAELPDAQTYHGREGLVQSVRESFELFEDFRFIPEQYYETDEHVVVVLRMEGRGKTSGVPVEDRIAHLWTMRDGRAVMLQAYSDPGEALEKAGLPRESA